MRHPPVDSVTTQEQAEFRLLATLLKWALGIGLASAVGLGVWIKGLNDAAAEVPALRIEVGTLRKEVRDFQEAMADLVLLQCAQPGLTPVEQRICAKYEPRMPR